MAREKVQVSNGLQPFRVSSRCQMHVTEKFVRGSGWKCDNDLVQLLHLSTHPGDPVIGEACSGLALPISDYLRARSDSLYALLRASAQVDPHVAPILREVPISRRVLGPIRTVSLHDY